MRERINFMKELVTYAIEKLGDEYEGINIEKFIYPNTNEIVRALKLTHYEQNMEELSRVKPRVNKFLLDLGLIKPLPSVEKNIKLPFYLTKEGGRILENIEEGIKDGWFFKGVLPVIEI